MTFPALITFEIALLAWAARRGWLAAKLRSQSAILRELPAILTRRRAVQAAARENAARFATHFTASLESPHLAGAARVPGVPQLLRLYWWLAVTLLRAIKSQ